MTKSVHLVCSNLCRQRFEHAKLPNCGNLLKLQILALRSDSLCERQVRVMTSGTVITQKIGQSAAPDSHFDHGYITMTEDESKPQRLDGRWLFRVRSLDQIRSGLRYSPLNSESYALT